MVDITFESWETFGLVLEEMERREWESGHNPSFKPLRKEYYVDFYFYKYEDTEKKHYQMEHKDLKTACFLAARDAIEKEKNNG